MLNLTNKKQRRTCSLFYGDRKFMKGPLEDLKCHKRHQHQIQYSDTNWQNGGLAASHWCYWMDMPLTWSSSKLQKSFFVFWGFFCTFLCTVNNMICIFWKLGNLLAAFAVDFRWPHWVFFNHFCIHFPTLEAAACAKNMRVVRLVRVRLVHASGPFNMQANQEELCVQP